MDPQVLFDAMKGAAGAEVEGLEIQLDGSGWTAKVSVARLSLKFEASEVTDVSGARALGALDTKIKERGAGR